MFEFATVKRISSAESDHCYVLAQLKTMVATIGSRAARLFRYENVWQSHAQYDDYVRSLWQTGSGQQGLQGIVDALGAVQQSLGAWDGK